MLLDIDRAAFTLGCVSMTTFGYRGSMVVFGCGEQSFCIGLCDDDLLLRLAFDAS